MVRSIYLGGFRIFGKCLVWFPKITRFKVEGKLERISNHSLAKYGIFLHIWVTYWAGVLPEFCRIFEDGFDILPLKS